jgi:hypothetical protein
MSVGRVRRRGLRLLALAMTVAVSSAVAVVLLAGSAGAADTGPPVTEIVPVRLHGHDSSWPPVLVFVAMVVVGGGIFVSVVFLRRAREDLRSGGASSTRS